MTTRLYEIFGKIRTNATIIGLMERNSFTGEYQLQKSRDPKISQSYFLFFTKKSWTSEVYETVGELVTLLGSRHLVNILWEYGASDNPELVGS